jgi:hypothetical protein
MVNLQIASLSIILSITIILAASIVPVVVALIGFGSIVIAQGQANDTSSLTPEQKAAMCDPNNPKLKFVNGTESRICGIPKTSTTSSSAAANATTTTSLENDTSPSILLFLAP